MSNSCNHNKLLKLELYKTLEDSSSKEIISGASALVRYEQTYFIIRDNSNSIYELDKNFNLVRTIPIFEGDLPKDSKARKKEKPDLEAGAVLYGQGDLADRLLLLPSGSKKNRVKGAIVTLQDVHRVKQVDFSDLYSFLREKVGTVNIEGAIFFSNQLLLFQRGNSENSRNALIYVRNVFDQNQEDELSLSKEDILDIKFPDLGHNAEIPYTFTDAVLFNESQIFFLAAAEDTDDAYLDGDIRGMIIGLMSIDGIIKWKKEISKKIKLEGISILNVIRHNEFDQVDVLMVSDADDDDIASEVYLAKIELVR